MSKRSVLRSAIAAIAMLLLGPNSFGQNEAWPSRPITMVVPASVGSGTDLLARELASRLTAALRQNILVDNKPGASGIIGTQAVVRAPADGYTILYTNGTNTVMAPALLKSLPYDIQKDLTPVAQTVAGGVFLLVNPGLPVRNLADLIQLVNASPDKYTYGTWAVGSSGHLTMEWLKKKTGMQIAHVPYRQTPQMMAELADGSLKIAWVDPAAPLPLIEAGKLRPIAVTGAHRLPRTPQVPTMGEQGHEFNAVGWFGVFAPAATPRQIIQRLSEEINKIQAQPEMVSRALQMNVSPSQLRTPAEFASVVANDLRMWRGIVNDADIVRE